MVDETVGRAREDAYFQQRDRELIEKLKEDARRRAERERLAEAAGLGPADAVLGDLEALGYTPSTFKLLHLVPLVFVAWADGSVTPEERTLILEAAQAHGIAEGDDARATLEGWLEQRPEDGFFVRTLVVIRTLLGTRPEDEQKASHESLVALCNELAAVSGGILGFGRVSANEKRVLDKVVKELQTRREAASQRVMDAL